MLKRFGMLLLAAVVSGTVAAVVSVAIGSVIHTMDDFEELAVTDDVPFDEGVPIRRCEINDPHRSHLYPIPGIPTTSTVARCPGIDAYGPETDDDSASVPV